MVGWDRMYNRCNSDRDTENYDSEEDNGSYSDEDEEGSYDEDSEDDHDHHHYSDSDSKSDDGDSTYFSDEEDEDGFHSMRRSMSHSMNMTLTRPRRLPQIPNKATFIHLVKSLQMPYVRKILGKWGYSRAGRKMELVQRIMTVLDPHFEAVDKTKFNSLVDDLNAMYHEMRLEKCNMAVVTSNIVTVHPFPRFPDVKLLDVFWNYSKKYENVQYELPFPWTIVEKVTPPIVTLFAKDEKLAGLVKSDFMAVDEVGSYFLIAIVRLYCDAEGNPWTVRRVKYFREFRDYPLSSSSPSSPSNVMNFHSNRTRKYRMASGDGLVCRFNNESIPFKLTPNGHVHNCTNRLKRGQMNEFRIDQFGRLWGRPYLIQIVRVKRSEAELERRTSAEVMAKLKKDFGGDGGGISTTSIKISLKCPLTLTKLTVPVRSKFCRHAQCFDMHSWRHLLQSNPASGAYLPPESSENFNCPICNMRCSPLTLYIDGLVEEMLSAAQGTVDDLPEVNIDIEAGKWSFTTTTLKSSVSTVDAQPNKRVKIATIVTPPSPTIIDLTVTPDDEYIGCSDEIPIIKPDPGLVTAPPATARNVNIIDLDGLAAVDGPVVLDDADVISFASYQSRHDGRSILDAIVID